MTIRCISKQSNQKNEQQNSNFNSKMLWWLGQKWIQGKERHLQATINWAKGPIKPGYIHSKTNTIKRLKPEPRVTYRMTAIIKKCASSQKKVFTFSLVLSKVGPQLEMNYRFIYQILFFKGRMINLKIAPFSLGLPEWLPGRFQGETLIASRNVNQHFIILNVMSSSAMTFPVFPMHQASERSASVFILIKCKGCVAFYRSDCLVIDKCSYS